jgi:ribosomal protein S18 acetylase RimI-like enzyme
MHIRAIRPDEYEALGTLTLEAYRALEYVSPDYEKELLDVATRATQARVLVAVSDDGTLLGGVTYVPDQDSGMAEFTGANTAGMRMLAVSAAARKQGVGETLVRECMRQAAADAREELVLHTTPWMRDAHRLYERLGFQRAAELDWQPVPEVPLLGYRWRVR